ncbi:MAG: hypothetical protein K0R99_2992 [Microbacterium sp.]|jgi:hypothetical protein|uniref:hypothetical protein n=1 Tax=Microbacterium sp. TaxID=51671 RepID=UPI002601CC25|nr:hypothetical protein [Microbacterium sp.]MDF2561546.1 hypothetical protein [Microbacterium sp.]
MDELLLNWMLPPPAWQAHHDRMDPVTGAMLVVAQFGVRQVGKTFLGDDAGALLASILGVLTQTDESQARLIAVEQKLDTLIEQRFTVGVDVGARLLRQSLLPNRSQAGRESDLGKAEAALLEAAQAARTRLQVAVAERLLILTRIAAGEAALAQDSVELFQCAVGDAIQANFNRRTNPSAEAVARASTGEFGKQSVMDRLNGVDPRLQKATFAVRREAQETALQLRDLVRFGFVAAAAVGSKGADQKPAFLERILVDLDSRIVVPIRHSKPGSVCGISHELAFQDISLKPNTVRVDASVTTDKGRKEAAFWALVGAEEDGSHDVPGQFEESGPGETILFHNDLTAPSDDNKPAQFAALVSDGLILLAERLNQPARVLAARARRLEGQFQWSSRVRGLEEAWLTGTRSAVQEPAPGSLGSTTSEL